MPPRPTGRLEWEDLPPQLRNRLEHTLNAPITHAVTPAGGFGHQLAAVVHTADGLRAFVKAAASDDSLTAANLHEATALETLPHGAPAPSLLGVHEAEGWTAVLIEHLDGPHPDLSPSSDDVAQVYALLDTLTSTPAAPRYLKAFAETPSNTAALHGWDTLLAHPPEDLHPTARAALPELAALEAAWPRLASGDRIVHGDLRSDNMVRDADRGVTFVDWAHAVTGPACTDAVSLAPQLLLAGHTPADVAQLLQDHPAIASTPKTATAFLAALTGHWERNARQPAPPGAPGLRSYQRRAANAGLALLEHRLQRPTP